MTISLEDVFAESMLDPEFRAEYEKLEPKYQKARKRILAKIAKRAKVSKIAKEDKNVNGNS